MLIAHELGKFAWEVENLPLAEIYDWKAFFEIRRELQDKVLKESRSKQGQPPSRGRRHGKRRR